MNRLRAVLAVLSLSSLVGCTDTDYLLLLVAGVVIFAFIWVCIKSGGSRIHIRGSRRSGGSRGRRSGGGSTHIYFGDDSNDADSSHDSSSDSSGDGE